MMEIIRCPNCSNLVPNGASCFICSVKFDDLKLQEAQKNIELANIWSELRMLEFSEEEITELKHIKHNLDYLKTFVELHKGALKIYSEEKELEAGIRRNSD